MSFHRNAGVPVHSETRVWSTSLAWLAEGLLSCCGAIQLLASPKSFGKSIAANIWSNRSSNSRTGESTNN
jgi:hypothetical protein